MNHIYRVVWNAALGLWQAVAECARGRGKTKSRRLGSATLAAGVFVLFSTAYAADLPTGGAITAGTGAIHQSSSNMTIDQGSNKLAIDWQGFSIGKNNSVTFNQPSASAIALNRVLGSDPSIIQGALRANGHVFLVNPNGVLFTSTAQVDVGGIVASTLNITNEDFLAGNYRFSGDSAAAIVNEGRIAAAHGGMVALVAARIVNEGAITAEHGSVLFGAGSKVELDIGEVASIEVEQAALDALIDNGGAIKADGGTILLTARAVQDLARVVINNDGLIEARSMAVGENGVVALTGEGGQVQVAGTIDVSGDKGGKAVVTGDEVTVAGLIDATGATDGGEIYVGGGWQGKDPAIAQAARTTITTDAVLDASATDNGDGGTVVAWSDVNKAESTTQVDGVLKATGGANGGNGGRIETSGAQLAVSQAADASAAHGQGGLWLLDPTNVTVAATGGAIGTSAVGLGAIDTALAGGTNVTIQADNNVTWSDDYSPTNISGQRTLSLLAKNINLNGDIDAHGASNMLNMVFDGDVLLGKDIALRTNGGDIIFGAYIDSATGVQAEARKLTLDTTGAITLGSGTVTFSDMVGGTNPLGSLYVTTSDTGKTYVNGAKIFTWNEQVYNSPVELGTVQFINPDFSDGTTGWTITDQRFKAGVTKIDGWTSPVDTSYPDSNGGLGDSLGTASATFSHDIVAGAAGQGNALQLSSTSANCNGTGHCIIRGSYVASDSTIALAKGETVSFDWSAAAGGDAHDVLGYLLNVKTGEAQIILNDTGDSDTSARPWTTASVTADKAGTYKFVFVSGSYDFTGGEVLGATLSIDNIKTSSGPKSINASAITFGKGLNVADNALNLQANEIDFGGPVSGTGSVSLQTKDPADEIKVGGTRAPGGDAVDDGVLDLSMEDIAQLQDGFTSITIGGVDMTGDINIVGDTTVHDDLVVNAGTGNINIDASLSSTDTDGNPAGVITLESNGGTVSQTVDGAIVADGLVLDGDGATYELDRAENDVDVLAGNTGSVSFSGVDDVTIGAIKVPGTESETQPDGETVTGLTTTGDIDITAGTINVEETLTSGGDIALTADEMDFSKGVSGSGELAINTKTDGYDIELGGADSPEKPGVLQLSGDDLAQLQDGFSVITVGNDSMTGDITVAGETTVKDDLVLNAGTKDIHIEDELISTEPNGTIALKTDGGTVDQTADGAITAGELVVTGAADVNLDLAANDVDVLAGDAGSIKFKDEDGVTIGAVTVPGSDPAQTVTGVTTTGDLEVTAGAITVDEAVTSGGSIALDAGSGDIQINDELQASDAIALKTDGGTVAQTADGAITAKELVLLGDDALHDLDDADNDIDTLAGDTGTVRFTDVDDVTIGKVTVPGSDPAQEVSGLTTTGDIDITAGTIDVQQAMTSGGDMVLTADEIDLHADIGGKGDLTFAPRTATNAIELGGVASSNSDTDAVLQLTEADLAHIQDGFNGIVVGGADQEGDITVMQGEAAGAEFHDDVLLQTKGKADVNGRLALVEPDDDNDADGAGGTGDGLTLAIVAAEGSTQGENGSIRADALALTGGLAGAGVPEDGGDFNFGGEGNWVGEIAVRDAYNVTFKNSPDAAAGAADKSLTVGELDLLGSDGNSLLASGPIIGIDVAGKIRIENTDGDIVVAENINTTYGGPDDAIVLNAGSSHGAAHAEGAIDGGNVVIGHGKTVSAEGDDLLDDADNGRIVIYTGDVQGSTGVDELVGIGSNNFRYNSTETEQNYKKALSEDPGVYAVYREQPVLQVSTNAHTNTDTKTADGTNTFDGGGMAGYDIIAGLVNGDTKEMLGIPIYSYDNAAPGTYKIRIGLTGELGYAVANRPENADLNVVPAEDYEAARHTVSDTTGTGTRADQPHLPDTSIDPSQAGGGSDVTSGGLILVNEPAGPSSTPSNTPSNTPSSTASGTSSSAAPATDGASSQAGAAQGGQSAQGSQSSQSGQPAQSDQSAQGGGESNVAQSETSGEGSLGGDESQASRGNDGGTALTDASGQSDGNNGESANKDDDGDVCVDGGEGGETTCAAHPPQTIFVVQGGVRLPQ